MDGWVDRWCTSAIISLQQAQVARREVDRENVVAAVSEVFSSVSVQLTASVLHSLWHGRSVQPTSSLGSNLQL